MASCLWMLCVVILWCAATAYTEPAQTGHIACQTEYQPGGLSSFKKIAFRRMRKQLFTTVPMGEDFRHYSNFYVTNVKHARDLCHMLGAQLVRIKDEQDLNLVIPHALNQGVPFLGSYIEGTDEENEGKWMHPSGEEPFLKWQEGYPNGGRDKNCLALANEGPKLMRDVACEDKPHRVLGVICEQKKRPRAKAPPIGCIQEVMFYTVGSIESRTFFQSKLKVQSLKTAKQICKSIGGHIAEVDNMDQFIWLNNNYKYITDGDLMFISGTDANKESHWRFHKSRKKNKFGGTFDGGREENCLALIPRKGDFMEIVDVPCATTVANFLCQVKEEINERQEPAHQGLLVA